jgi:hypothetical protein
VEAELPKLSDALADGLAPVYALPRGVAYMLVSPLEGPGVPNKRVGVAAQVGGWGATAGGAVEGGAGGTGEGAVANGFTVGAATGRGRVDKTEREERAETFGPAGHSGAAIERKGLAAGNGAAAVCCTAGAGKRGAAGNGAGAVRCSAGVVKINAAGNGAGAVRCSAGAVKENAAGNGAGAVRCSAGAVLNWKGRAESMV